jgi:putative redox protein
MKSVSTWIEGYQSKVTNERGHEVILDLPVEQGGKDVGATALELAVMGLSGCVSTIFAMVAKNSGLEFDSLSVDVTATKAADTIDSADIAVSVKTDDADKASIVLDKTLKACPVGVLYEKAGVKITHKLVVI